MHEHGGPEVLRWEEIESRPLEAGAIRVRHEAVGLNYIDVYHRTGLYPVPALPCVPGLEGAGVVAEVGPEVTGLEVGDRVAYASPPLGAYAEERALPADRAVRLPEGITAETAASLMLQGMTAEYLIRRTYPCREGETVLLHAAAGGVGLLASQWLHALGVEVIGTVGSPAKAELARAHGCTHTILYREEDIAGKVRDLTGGRGVPVVYDSVGQATWEASLDCLQPRGLMVSFGNSSGPVEPVHLGELSQKGSLFVTRPTLMHYTAERWELEASARALFEVVLSGKVRPHLGQRFPLREAAAAHRALEARETVGSTVLTVDG
jgi:NADPH2:quinone reductase